MPFVDEHAVTADKPIWDRQISCQRMPDRKMAADEIMAQTLL